MTFDLNTSALAVGLLVSAGCNVALLFTVLGAFRFHKRLMNTCDEMARQLQLAELGGRMPVPQGANCEAPSTDHGYL